MLCVGVLAPVGHVIHLAVSFFWMLASGGKLRRAGAGGGGVVAAVGFKTRGAGSAVGSGGDSSRVVGQRRRARQKKWVITKVIEDFVEGVTQWCTPTTESLLYISPMLSKEFACREGEKHVG